MVGMKVSTSKSEVMVLCWKKVDCALWVGSELLPQAKEFKYFGVLFTSEGKMEHEIDRLIGAASAVMWALFRTIVVKRELSRKASQSSTMVMTQNTLEGLYISSGLGTPQDPPRGAGKRCWGEGHLDYFAEPAATVAWPRISRRKWMDGWMKKPSSGHSNSDRSRRKSGAVVIQRQRVYRGRRSGWMDGSPKHQTCFLFPNNSLHF